MAQPPKFLTYFGVEEQRLRTDHPPSDGATHHVCKAESSDSTKEDLFKSP